MKARTETEGGGLEQSLLEALQLPPAPRIKLRESPLALVVCQVQFGATLSAADPSALAPFQRSLAGDYPIAQPVAQLQMQLQVGPGEADIRQSGAGQAWTFSDSQDNWAVALSPTSLSLETRKYSEFREFLDRLRRVLTSLIQHIAPAFATRVGVRYVNEIPSVGASWRTAVSPEILGPLIMQPLEERATQFVGRLVLSLPDDFGVNMQYGSFLQGTTVRPPVSTVQGRYDNPFFLLDFDVFRAYQPNAPLGMEAEAILDQVRVYHDVAYRLFRWSVTDTYIQEKSESVHGST